METLLGMFVGLFLLVMAGALVWLADRFADVIEAIVICAIVFSFGGLVVWAFVKVGIGIVKACHRYYF